MATNTGPDAPPAPTGHVRWRRVLLILMIPVLGFVGIGHAAGAGVMETGGLVAAGAVAGGAVLYPRIRRHFDWRHHHPRQPSQHGRKGHSRQWTANWRRGGSKAHGTMGRRHR